jgi:hypothetical protein
VLNSPVLQTTTILVIRSREKLIKESSDPGLALRGDRSVRHGRGVSAFGLVRGPQLLSRPESVVGLTRLARYLDDAMPETPTDRVGLGFRRYSIGY